MAGYSGLIRTYRNHSVYFLIGDRFTIPYPEIGCMDESTVAYIQKIAPGKMSSEWHQRGLKRLINEWRTTDPGKYELLVSENNMAVAIGYHIYPSGLGQYGFDTGYEFVPDLRPDLEPDVDNIEQICNEAFERWMDYIQDIIAESQDRSLFTPKELASLYANRNPKQTEKEAADALDITVGTYRGKVGRVKNKLKEAQATLSISGPSEPDGYDEWSGKSYSAHPSVIDRLDEERLPVNSVHEYIGHELSDVPVDELVTD